MFNKIIRQIRHRYGIKELNDWRTIKPEQVIRVKGVGQSCLDHLRMYLAQHDITLAGDESPEHWKKNATARVGHSLSYGDTNVQVPFTVVIDCMEQLPWSFENIAADASDTPGDLSKMVSSGEIEQSDIKLIVPKKVSALGVASGDYSIAGYRGQCNIERKSMDDAHSTILGWGDHRRRFVKELENLAAMDAAAVVVECSIGELLAKSPSRGKKTADENRKILHRQICAWQQDYRVPWIFCDTRRLAEITAFRIMQRFFRKQLEAPEKVNVSIEEIKKQVSEL